MPAAAANEVVAIAKLVGMRLCSRFTEKQVAFQGTSWKSYSCL